MKTILMKASVFIFIIIMGYTLKRLRFFKASDFSLISKIVMNITLPAAVISSFSKLTMGTSYLILVAFGIICNLITIGIGYMISIKKSNTDKAFHMINLSGYNIGSFTMPYIQSFLGPAGVVVTCLFDAGNAMLCTGGTYSIVSAATNIGEKTTLTSGLKKLFSSIAMDTYLIMLILSLLHIKLPEGITLFSDTVGAANGFLAMLMIGIGFEVNFRKSQQMQLVKVLSIRYGVAVLFSLFFYFCLPLPLEIRQVLVLVAFAPLSSMCTAFTEKCGGDLALSSAINSVSIIISVTIMTGILLNFQIS